MDFSDVSLDSVTGAAAVAGLGGRFSWFSDRLRDRIAPGTDSAVFKSRLGWESARLWGIEFGAASIPFTTTGRHFRLLDPVVLPLFDGGLSVETLRLRHAGTPQMYLRFDAQLAPVSLRLLTRSLGWPEFSGTLSGRIPSLQLEQGFVTLDGNLEASVFDGSVTVRNLRMRDPLGEYPQLFADIDVERLDLAQVTDTFEFGMITGRLSGRVEGLETFDWMPVAFDASFYSTPGDRSPRRIDQRAVSNLSSIGGGSGGSVAAAMQGRLPAFLRQLPLRPPRAFVPADQRCLPDGRRSPGRGRLLHRQGFRAATHRRDRQPAPGGLDAPRAPARRHHRISGPGDRLTTASPPAAGGLSCAQFTCRSAGAAEHGSPRVRQGA